jgi:hypothetical protein
MGVEFFRFLRKDLKLTGTATILGSIKFAIACDVPFLLNKYFVKTVQYSIIP